MNIPKWAVWVSVLDCAVFLVADIGRTFAKSGFIATSVWFYWGTVWLGLVLAVLGFLALTRGGPAELKKSVVCILFALIPACVGLVTVLARIGSPIGGVHV